LLNARLTKSKLDFSGDNWTFEFRDVDGGLIADGSVPAIRRQPARVRWKIARQMGVRGLLNYLRTPFFRVTVMNTRRQNEGRNHVCATYTTCKTPLIRYSTNQDLVFIKEPRYAELGFRISFVQVLNDIGFIFMRPTSF